MRQPTHSFTVTWKTTDGESCSKVFINDFAGAEAYAMDLDACHDVSEVEIDEQELKGDR